ncbi:MAG: HNH endonuclease [Thaumarchaeota archaeon]|nr:HNH endonuclease [Nitrososphaerota archaeon]
MLTQERLKELLSYDPKTGVFRWIKPTSNRVSPGSLAGTINMYGYLVIRIDRRTYHASRLAWLYETGSWPVDEIDHIDRDRLNNRWSNLRGSTRSQNMCNVGDGPRGLVPFRGVTFDKERGLYQAKIRKNKRTVMLGRFSSAEIAARAYDDAAVRFHGAFARTNFRDPQTGDITGIAPMQQGSLQ